MLVLAALAVVLPPFIGLAVVRRSRMVAMEDADRLCRGYW